MAGRELKIVRSMEGRIVIQWWSDGELYLRGGYTVSLQLHLSEGA